MTATEELRKLLDERGVEYEIDDAKVSDSDWYRVTYVKEKYGKTWVYEEPPDCYLLISYSHDLGAEEAIDVTLGASTCHIVKTWTDSDYAERWRYSCSECGYQIEVGERDVNTGDPVSHANFCWNCGRRVVDE